MSIDRSRTPAYRDMLKRRCHQRLASEMLLSALRDWFIWHSKEGQRVRKAFTQIERNGLGTVKPGEFKRLKIEKYTHGRVRDILMAPDPALFLCANSIWHESANVDHETFQRIVDSPARASAVQRALKMSTKKSPLRLAAQRAS